jgi:hypothetical protein
MGIICFNQTTRAIRGRIRRGTIEWKAAGNTGKLVRVPDADPSADDVEDGPEDEPDQLREELMEAREQLAAAKASLDASVAVRKAEVGALRELADRLSRNSPRRGGHGGGGCEVSKC